MAPSTVVDSPVNDSENTHRFLPGPEWNTFEGQEAGEHGADIALKVMRVAHRVTEKMRESLDSFRSKMSDSKFNEELHRGNCRKDAAQKEFSARMDAHVQRSVEAYTELQNALLELGREEGMTAEDIEDIQHACAIILQKPERTDPSGSLQKWIAGSVIRTLFSNGEKTSTWGPRYHGDVYEHGMLASHVGLLQGKGRTKIDSVEPSDEARLNWLLGLTRNSGSFLGAIAVSGWSPKEAKAIIEKYMQIAHDKLDNGRKIEGHSALLLNTYLISPGALLFLEKIGVSADAVKELHEKANYIDVEDHVKQGLDKFVGWDYELSAEGREVAAMKPKFVRAYLAEKPWGSAVPTEPEDIAAEHPHAELDGYAKDEEKDPVYGAQVFPKPIEVSADVPCEVTIAQYASQAAGAVIPFQSIVQQVKETAEYRRALTEYVDRVLHEQNLYFHRAQGVHSSEVYDRLRTCGCFDTEVMEKEVGQEVPGSDVQQALAYLLEQKEVRQQAVQGAVDSLGYTNWQQQTVEDNTPYSEAVVEGLRDFIGVSLDQASAMVTRISELEAEGWKTQKVPLSAEEQTARLQTWQESLRPRQQLLQQIEGIRRQLDNPERLVDGQAERLAAILPGLQAKLDTVEDKAPTLIEAKAKIADIEQTTKQVRVFDKEGVNAKFALWLNAQGTDTFNAAEAGIIRTELQKVQKPQDLPRVPRFASDAPVVAAVHEKLRPDGVEITPDEVRSFLTELDSRAFAEKRSVTTVQLTESESTEDPLIVFDNEKGLIESIDVRNKYRFEPGSNGSVTFRIQLNGEGPDPYQTVLAEYGAERNGHPQNGELVVDVPRNRLQNGGARDFVNQLDRVVSNH